jgi:hypothetical protein
MSSPVLVDARAVARRFGVTYATVLSWARRGVVPCLRAGKHPVRFDLSAVEAAMNQRARSGAGAASMECAVMPAIGASSRDRHHPRHESGTACCRRGLTWTR